MAVVLLFCFGMADAQKNRKARKRPARTAKTQDKRVYLVHAAVLHFDQYRNPDATILNGKVHFIRCRWLVIMPIMMVTNR